MDTVLLITSSMSYGFICRYDFGLNELELSNGFELFIIIYLILENLSIIDFRSAARLTEKKTTVTRM